MTDKEQTNDSLKNQDKNFNENFTQEKEQIMIDGIDVSECIDFNRRDKVSCYHLLYDKCNENPNCYFKQLARKTQECEELKRKLSNQEQLYQNEIEIYNKSCLQLRQENDDLYLERLALNTANSGINALLEVKEQESNRYRKALEEIEEVINNILNSCLGRNTVGCRPAHNVCGDLIKILDIINKAKGKVNE